MSLRLFSVPDGVVDRKDRGFWLTTPFDIAFSSSTPPSVTTYDTELEAVQAAYLASSSLVAAVAGRWYLDEAPEGTILPYVTMTLVSRSHEQTTGLVRAVESVVQVSIHHRLPSLCKPIRTLILGALDRVALAIDGAATGHCLLDNEIISKAEGKAPGGKDCWMHMLDFSILHSPDTGS